MGHTSPIFRSKYIALEGPPASGSDIVGVLRGFIIIVPGNYEQSPSTENVKTQANNKLASKTIHMINETQN